MRRVIALLAGGTLILAGAATLVWRTSYHGWPWQLPDPLTWCGRDYVKTSDELRGTPLRAAGRYPPIVGRQVLTDVPAAVQARRQSTHQPCALLVYLSSSSGNRVYALSGGP